MSRYLYSDCERFRNKYLKKFDDVLFEIDKNYDDMDFENAKERLDMRTELDEVKRLMNIARDELLAMRFE
jgi:hypothetical protein